MKIRSLARPLAALTLTLSLGLVAVADTIHLKDGQVIRGQIVSFRDQQFTVRIGAGARGRRSQVTVYMEDVDSIEFDSAGRADTAAGDNNYTPPPLETSRPPPAPPRPTRPRQPRPAPSPAPAAPAPPSRPRRARPSRDRPSRARPRPLRRSDATARTARLRQTLRPTTARKTATKARATRAK